MPAAAWRALFLFDTSDDGQTWTAEPLFALAVCHVSEYQVDGNTGNATNIGREVHGYIYDEAGLIECAEKRLTSGGISHNMTPSHAPKR